MQVFDQFADWIGYVASLLGDDQKSTLGMLYKLAGESKGKLAKIDQLAGAEISKVSRLPDCWGLRE